jgi:SAM-dependent MidA family methyltransferase
MAEREPDSLSAALSARVAGAIQAHGGWLPFDRFMSLVLYEPGLGYYARGAQLFGSLPSSGSDFVTAPELSPLFGRALARQVGQALDATGTAEVVEFGAGSGALAAQLLGALGERVRRYRIVELSAPLRERQAQALARWAGRVEWLDALPDTLDAVLVGNEVLDAMPVQLLVFDGARWAERGVAAGADGLAWADRPTALRPPVDCGFAPGTVTEVHAQAEAFVRTLAARLRRGAAFFIDYGFPDHEYYHPQRLGGTLMCHRAHRADAGADAPLRDLGRQDITAHVNFSAIALAAQDAGLDVLGYTSQARFLLNCGFADELQRAGLRDAVNAQRLITEHEMGELFKVIGLSRGAAFDAIGFAQGDRSHRL